MMTIQVSPKIKRRANAVQELGPFDIGYHTPPEGIMETVALIGRRPIPLSSFARDTLIETAAHKVFARAEGMLFFNGDSIPFNKMPECVQEFCRDVVRDVTEVFGL